MSASAQPMTVTVDGVRLAAVCACLPPHAEDNLARCTALYGDAAKAESVVKATGIRTRRVAAPGTTSLDLCLQAAETVLRESRTDPAEIGAVIAVSFTPAQAMPCNACQAQARLGLPRDLAAFDVGLACSGWPYGLFLAAQFARATGRKVLLLDGDVQTPFLRADDAASVPVLADAGTAALVAPASGAPAWSFAFLTAGEQGTALTLPPGGPFAMDGMAVFKFVATDVASFLRRFLDATHADPAALDAFVPHQANMYMIRQLAKALGFRSEQLAVSGDVFGNPASASVPLTLAHAAPRGRVLAAGFGGGLSASAVLFDLPPEALLRVQDAVS